MKNMSMMPYRSFPKTSSKQRRQRRHLSFLFAMAAVLAAVLFIVGRGPLKSTAPSPKPSPQTQIESEDSQPEHTEPIEETASSKEGIVVCLDAGHGGKDAGCSTEERLESSDTLRLALAIQQAMEAQGIQVVMTRTADTYLSLEERCTLANEAEADFFLSIHRNYAGGVAYGVEVWKSCNASEVTSQLAQAVSSALEEVGVQRNRGIHIGSQSSESEDYYVLRNTAMPSLLLEMGFLENEEDNRYFDTYLEDYAEAITQAVLDTYENFHED